MQSKNKATDFKNLIQHACKTEKPQTLQAKHTDLEAESRITKVGANSLITQLKQLNMRNGLTTVGIKNKQNLCSNNKKKKTYMTNSISSVNTETSISMKQIKMTPISTSVEHTQKINNIKIGTNRDLTGIKLQKSGIRVPPATSREKSPELIRAISFGFKITDFNLGKKLGKGRFGNVRLAQNKVTRFILAIKTINITQLKQSQMESQLIEQIKLQMFCNHPNLLKMYGCFSDSKNIYLLLELGIMCLFHELRADKHFEEEKTAYYVNQMIEGLKYVHSESIIHRDIKPENILVNNGVLKLSDFGWATYSPLLKRHTFCGTLDYVPPEIVNGDYYDQKVDIWSLGVLCYELAVGKAPFEDSRSQEATYDKILTGQILFPETTSSQLKDMISKILLKNPYERPSISQIQNHVWLQKYKNIGRYISKQIWNVWQALKSDQ